MPPSSPRGRRGTCNSRTIDRDALLYADPAETRAAAPAAWVVIGARSTMIRCRHMEGTGRRTSGAGSGRGPPVPLAVLTAVPCFERDSLLYIRIQGDGSV